MSADKTPDGVDPDVAEALRASNPNATGAHGLEGGMGVSSEIVGHAGPGQHSTDGLRDTSPGGPDPDEAPPEQSAGGEEPKPIGIPPKAAPPESAR